ncbi:MAG: hypothetical protein QOH79_388 [Acidimicrobiaceae bacterium]
MPLRPMTVADILDGGIAVIKAAPRSVFVIAATFILPLELLTAWLERDSLSDRGFAGAISAVTSPSSSSSSGLTWTGVGLIVASGLVLSLITGAIAHLLSSWYADSAPSTADAIKTSVRRAPALIVAWFIVHAVEVPALLALVVPAIFVMPLFLVTAPAIVIERLGPWAGARRSWQLTRVRYGAVLGAGLLIAVVSTALTIALSGLGLAFSFLSFGWIIDVICRAASSLVTEPFVAAATTLVYLDLRIRAEGLDLELDIAEHFHRVG